MRILSVIFIISLKIVIAKAIITTCQLQYGGKIISKDNYKGPTICDHGKSPGIIVDGPLNTTGTHFEGLVSVDGSISARKTTFHNLSVTGEANLHTVESNNIKIYGPLFMKNTQTKNIEAYTTKIYLNKSQAKSILVITQNINKKSKKPTVTLVDKSAVFGNIEFRGDQGIVKIEGPYTIKGKIIHGILEK